MNDFTITLSNLIDFKALSFDVICEKIAHGEHFSLARYGDGEFNAILGFSGENCDGHEYFPKMGEDLADILKRDPSYFIGLHQSKVIQQETLQWLHKHQLLWQHYTGNPRQFVSNAVFHDAIIGKRKNSQDREAKLFDKFWQALDGKKVMIVGPSYLRKRPMLKNADYLITPDQNTYLQVNVIVSDLLSEDLTDRVVLICASMSAPIIVDRLHQVYQNRATFIDFGSSFDPYIKESPFQRSFHKNALI